jgi:peptide/nickel transport system substrate-binding protein
MVIAFAAPGLTVSPSAEAAYAEAPEMAAQVQAGSLPPLTERLPQPPFVDPLDRPWQSVGRYGGQLRLLMGKSRDLRQMTVYGYARLVGYNAELELVPDILEKVEIEDNRVFTFHLRRGHKWSDGHPFTTEDFRYWWDDVANNEELSPAGIPNDLLMDGERPTFEVLDETRVRYSWPNPNPTLLHALAGARPLYLYAPAHYLKQFHTRYADQTELEAMVAEKEMRNWAALHSRKSNAYKNKNPKLPTLQPWVNSTKPPSERFVFKRNPYFHRVDPEGRQLPYIDEVVVYIAGSSIIPAKVGAGASDLQARYIRFDNYTFLKATEERQKQKVQLWTTARGARIALYPNLNVNDEVYRTLFRDVRFRRALSLAIHRHEINQVVFFGSPSKATTPCCRAAPCSARNTKPPGPASTSTRQMPCSTKSGSSSATIAAFACCPTGGRWKSSSNRRARAPRRPMSSNSSPTAGRRPGSSFTPSHRNGKCFATASSPATPRWRSGPDWRTPCRTPT